MGEGAENIVVESVALASVADALQQTLPFSGTKVADLGDVGMVDRVTAATGALLSEPGRPVRDYWVLLEGEIRTDRPEPDGSQTVVGVARTGEGFGETLLLLGKVQTHFFVRAVKPSVLIRFSLEVFWKLMSCCPSARADSDRSGAEAAGLPGGGAAPGEADLSGHTGSGFDARVAQSWLGGQAG